MVMVMLMGHGSDLRNPWTISASAANVHMVLFTLFVTEITYKLQRCDLIELILLCKVIAWLIFLAAKCLAKPMSVYTLQCQSSDAMDFDKINALHKFQFYHMKIQMLYDKCCQYNFYST